MATQRGVHPSAEVLKAFGLGKLDDGTSGVVGRHLDQCEDCRKEVAALSGDDFLHRLRQAQGLSSTGMPAKTPARAPQPRAGKTPSNIPPELAANQQYEILRELGRGGMGVVYLAKNKLMDRIEVLKVVNKALLDHPGAVERFLREIRSAAKLNHANVVAAYSAVQQGELLAFAMEYVEGQDLASVVKSQGPLPIPHACFYVQQAAHGLQHAFEKGMVHRDIKPQNLILAREGKKHIVKVLDFGLAKVMREKTDDASLTGEGKMLGTPDYIAPEQTMDAAHADIRADIYSLGCTLYYLLSGHPPFSASSLGAILVAHQMHEARPLNLVRPEVPEELAAVVRRMMAKTPAKRYQTPLEVVQVLSPFVKQGTTPKAAPELSVGTAAAKPVIKMAAPIAPPPAPVAEAPKQQPQSASVWESLTEDSAASVIPRKSGADRRPQTVTLRQRTSRKKWLLGGGIGVGVLLLALAGMWAGGVFKVKVREENEAKPFALMENPPALNPPPVDAPPHPTRRNDYDELATGRWVPVLPSVEEFNRLLAEKAYRAAKVNRGADPRFVDGVLHFYGGGLLFPPIKARDAIIRARVKKLGPKNNGNINLSLRGIGAWFNGGGFFGIGRKRNNSWKDLTFCQLSEPYNDYFEFALAAIGDKLIVYANGRQILEARDDVLLDGPADVGVGARTCHGLFRSIEVQVLDKPAAAEENGQPTAKRAEPKKKTSLSDRIPDGTVLTGTYLFTNPGGESGATTLTITEREGKKVKGRYGAKAARAAQAYPGWAFEGEIIGNRLTARSVGNAAKRTLTVSLKGDALEGTVVLLDKRATARVAFTFDK